MLHSVGFMIRETGQALDRLGCLLLDNPSYRETCALARGVQLHFALAPHTVWRHKPLLNLINVVPKLGSNAFVAESAAVVGDVQLGNNASVWYGAVVRGVSGGHCCTCVAVVNFWYQVTWQASPLGRAPTCRTTLL